MIILLRTYDRRYAEDLHEYLLNMWPKYKFGFEDKQLDLENPLSCLTEPSYSELDRFVVSLLTELPTEQDVLFVRIVAAAYKEGYRNSRERYES
jgi:hypothetical protein